MLLPRKKRLKKLRAVKILKLITAVIIISAVIFAVFVFKKDLFKKKTETIFKLQSTQAVTSLDKLRNLLNKDNIAFDKVIVASDSSYLVFLQNNGEVILSPSKSLSSQISSLQVILFSFTIEGKVFKRLDLRFDKPVVVF